MKKIAMVLPEDVVQQLQGEKLVFVVSVNTAGEIHATAISWLVAVDESLIRFAISPKSPLLENIKQQPRIKILVTLPGYVLAIEGRARVQPQPIPDVAFPMSCVEVEVDQVDDIMFYGGLVISEAKYEKTYSAELSKKLDSAIYKTLREAR
ncbi:pyridoxamine 5'-phosphate oxidase family protein [Thermoflavimicrobium dichotomicum]|uniref:Pyridoxamine 5'-phosphate oxidase n=1 Tax=Thermoflavimicrobium dichotomicum TaxID=46223 RepID=A0A1I3JP23_9BACL|nr:pyridoxamine 5'-phosphate oxidase family protein [Thermoflavimicrobium dichotomicum]SFI62022.1 Pyridoxamine 5'-phosphate oxidase [Thermoflavimicrobium dichotomicum]